MTTPDLTPEEIEAALLQAMADAWHEEQETEDEWQDDWRWCADPGPGYDADLEMEKGGDR